MKTYMESFVGAVVLGACIGGTSGYAQGQANTSPAATPLTPSTTLPANDSYHSNISRHNTRLTDAQIATWLLIENQELIEISQHVADYATDDSVKKFARSVVDQHGRMATKLHQPIAATFGQANKESVNIGEVFSQIADRIESEQFTDRDRRPLRQLNDRAEDRREDVEELRKDVREQREERREAVQEEREDVGEARRDVERRDGERDDNREVREAREEVRETRRENVVEGRQQIQEERQEVRNDVRDGDVRRERLRRALPMLRDSLPDIIDAIGSAIEESERMNADSTDLAVLHFKHDVSRRNTDRLKQELMAKQGDNHLDEAYLGYVLLAHLEMIDTLETASQRSSATLKPTLNEGLAMVKEHLTQAKGLMKQAEAKSGR